MPLAITAAEVANARGPRGGVGSAVLCCARALPGRVSSPLMTDLIVREPGAPRAGSCGSDR
ncbi:hypothetical protein GCM10027067_36650 [Pseudactinotalea suaedae]